ncbi:MAG: DUF374 domain-containing protein [Lentisphaerae bacterium]|nr:DUF374 domain-containing protein [Lentisphaerota bacterium]
MNFFKTKFRQTKKLPDWIFAVAATLIKVLFKCLYRCEVNDRHNLCQDGRGAIGMAWHNRLLFFAPALPGPARKRTMAVVSPSRDGQYIADFLKYFDVGALRGSSRRQGANALLGAIHAIQEGKNIAFTPDGPRGPRYVLKPGPIVLASKTGAPIYPIGLNYSRYWSVKSWDAFQIPKPGAKITLDFGDPIYIPADLDADGIEHWRQIVEKAMNEINAVDLPLNS